ncbi:MULTISPECIES: YhfG family protein [Achromobacter]|uniref:YhfG family protein n=1 Tax=Achromobacter sp. TaxID=134375 RepID=UPI002F942BF8
MKNSTLQAKLDYWEKVRRLNYAASMRLEGYPLTPADAKRELPSREAVLRAYRKPA